jgi:hypothetical protein
MQLLSDAALACPGWMQFEISGLIMGALLGLVLGILIAKFVPGGGV